MAQRNDMIQEQIENAAFSAVNGTPATVKIETDEELRIFTETMKEERDHTPGLTYSTNSATLPAEVTISMG
jgi:hypothetical protein